MGARTRNMGESKPMVLGVAEQRIIGAGCMGFGAMFASVGVFVLDNGLLALGNILFLSGIMTLLGISRCLGLFVATESLIGTVGFVSGLSILMTGWARIGVIMEVVGLLWVFKGLIRPML